MRIGVDLGGTKIEAALLDDDGQIMIRKRIPAPVDNYQATVNDIAELVTELEQSISDRSPVASVGIGTPGAISVKTGLIKNSNNNCLNNRPFKRDLAQVLQKEISIANDADCFTLSEAMDGSAKDSTVVFGVILGTGVGGGICIKKNLVQGVNAITGEWGHNPLPVAAKDFVTEFSALAYSNLTHRECSCGRIDCVETWLSGPGLQLSYYEASGSELSAPDIVKLAEEGDKLANTLLENYCRMLALALSTVINILDPDVIVLGGGISNIERLYRDVPEYWNDYVFSDRVDTRLVKAKYGDSSGVRGAAWL